MRGFMFLLALLVLVVVASEASAGPFGLFNRADSSPCANGSCLVPVEVVIEKSVEKTATIVKKVIPKKAPAVVPAVTQPAAPSVALEEPATTTERRWTRFIPFLRRR